MSNAVEKFDTNFRGCELANNHFQNSAFFQSRSDLQSSLLIHSFTRVRRGFTRHGCDIDRLRNERRRVTLKVACRHSLRANCGRVNLTGEGDSCARVRVGVLAHHRSDAFANRGAPLAFNFRSILPADPVAQQEIDFTGALSEQFVTIGAASLALLVVAAIAVLMGMA